MISKYERIQKKMAVYSSLSLSVLYVNSVPKLSSKIPLQTRARISNLINLELDIKAIGTTQDGNACSLTILTEPNPNIKKAFEVRLWPAIQGEKERIYQTAIHCATSTLRLAVLTRT